MRLHITKRDVILTAIFSLCFSFAIAAPNWAIGDWSKTTTVIAAIGIFFVACCCLLMALDRIKSIRRITNAPHPAFKHEKRLWFIVFLVLELAAIISILSNYPGFCTTDSNDIIAQALGTSTYQNHHRYDGLANHHPVFYTFLVWAVLEITAFLNDIYASIFCFSLIQATFVCICVSWAAFWLNRHTSNKVYVIAVAAFFVFSPVLMAHVAIMWKDVPFSALMLVTILFLFDLSKEKTINPKQAIKLTCLLISLTFLRNNGLYISIALLAYMLIVFNDSRTIIARCSTAFLAIALIVQGPVFSALSIEKGHFSESVGVPLQQIANTLASKGETSEEQREFLNQILPLSEWENNYKATSPNPLKFSANFDDGFLENNKIEFLAIWVSILPDNLNYYIEAWILETRGYWQPGFQGSIGAEYTINQEKTLDLLGLNWDPSQVANSLRNEFPLLFDMGSYIWIIALGSLVCICGSDRKVPSRKQFTCCIPIFALFATMLIAAPIVSDFRYILAFYLVLPFVPILSAIPQRA